MPPPQQNFKLFVKYSPNEWEDLFDKINSVHQANRLGGKEALLLSLSNSLRYYVASVPPVSRIETDRENINFKILEKIIKGYYKNRRNSSGQSEILIAIENINSNTIHFHYYKPE